jgi:hypothetical protein
VAYVVVLGACEIAPHALQRTMRLSPPFVLPMTSVRWLPHFGQTGGASGRFIASSASLTRTILSSTAPIFAPTAQPHPIRAIITNGAGCGPETRL